MTDEHVECSFAPTHHFIEKVSRAAPQGLSNRGQIVATHDLSLFVCWTSETSALMADIFLSYSREDEARIRGLVSQIEAQGWSVFWDQRIPAGETWRSHIGSALQDSRCIVVAWSKHSIDSQWVAEEADEGKTRRVLIPLLLDHVQPPRGFREIQAADISDWHAGQTSERFNELIEDIRDSSESSPRKAERRHILRSPSLLSAPVKKQL